MRKFYAFFVAIIFALNYNSKACSPLNVPILVSFTVTPTTLNIDWKSTTSYTGCPDVIDVEIVSITSSFTGLASNTFTTPAYTATSVPYFVPTQTINISSFCSGATYQFRARERNSGMTTSSAWTISYTFTTLGTAPAPSVLVSASPATITPCPSDTSYFVSTIINGCGNPPYNYTWTPGASLSCTNCANPVAFPTSTTIYTVTAKGGPLGGWIATNTVQVTVNICTSLSQLNPETIHLNILPNPNNGQFLVSSNASDAVDLFIYNSLGQLILSVPKSKNGTGVDLSRFGKGIYSITIRAEGQFNHTKIVVD